MRDLPGDHAEAATLLEAAQLAQARPLVGAALLAAARERVVHARRRHKQPRPDLRGVVKGCSQGVQPRGHSAEPMKAAAGSAAAFGVGGACIALAECT